MPMSDAGMGSAIIAKVKAIPGLTIQTEAEFEAYHNALGAAIVEYVTANALVTITSANAIGVQSGSDQAPVTGTGEVS